ncbi:MAG: serine hydrolase [Myxococcales bacterium]|nr:serine hydrolase [Myxococcales bacterium]
MRRTCIVLITAVSFGLGACRLWATEPSSPAVEVLDHSWGEVAQAIEARLDAYPGEVELGVWVGDGAGRTLLARQPDLELAVASAIKAAFLVEWFAAHADRLDEPLAEAEAILSDPHHEAVAHFSPERQAEIAAALVPATVREIGFAMIGARLGPEGPKVSNPVYNAAANLVTASLGGPEAMTARIHGRFGEATSLVVRRYMLAARDTARGDNTASAKGLGMVLSRIADGRVAGVSAQTLEAVRDALRVPAPPGYTSHFRKWGSLNSDPQCRVRAGWVEGERGVRIYAVMVQQPESRATPSRYDYLGPSPSAAGLPVGEVPAKELAKLAKDVSTLVLAAP